MLVARSRYTPPVKDEGEDMAVRLIFVIGAPRSGTTMLERMLESHSRIMGGPEPQLLTPLAHLGYFDQVDKAPYDHILAAESQRLFVERLPGKEQDYIDACRAYCDLLYGRMLTTTGKPFFLDKTPAYGLILPFMQKVFPDAKYVVLTRHPVAIFSSYANSFFDGDYQVAQNYNPILNRYVPAIAKFLRQQDTPYFHVKYEKLVTEPEVWMERICAHIGVPFEQGIINYGETRPEAEAVPRVADVLVSESAGMPTLPVCAPKGLGDPIGVQQHSRPSTASVHKWVEEVAANPTRLTLMQTVINQIDPEDLKTFGYPREDIWKPLEAAQGKTFTPKRQPLTRYRLQRKLIVTLRRTTQKSATIRGLLKKVRLAVDVLLRE